MKHPPARTVTVKTGKHCQRWRGRGGLEASGAAGGTQNGAAAVENSTEVPRRVNTERRVTPQRQLWTLVPKHGRQALRDALLLSWSRQDQAQASRGGSVLDVPGGTTAPRQRGLAYSRTVLSLGRKVPPHTTT